MIQWSTPKASQTCEGGTLQEGVRRVLLTAMTQVRCRVKSKKTVSSVEIGNFLCQRCDEACSRSSKIAALG